MSKWISKDVFKEFTEEKKKEVDGGGSGGAFFEKKWKALEKGPSDNPKTYEVRFLPDPKAGFYKKISYHMWKSGEKWNYFTCPKTEDINNPCPICSVVSKLFNGSENDKTEARKLKRKEKFVSNVFVSYDPRDAGKAKDDESKAEGKVLFYEFPSKLEQKLAEEIKDSRNGLGSSIFDPSSDGYNFIIKVGTQSGGDGKQSFPEYSMSTFARRPGAIAESDAEIDKLMSERIPMGEYISKSMKPLKDLCEAMKAEMFWELVERDFTKYLEPEGSKVETNSKSEAPKAEERKSEAPKAQERKSESSSEDLSEEELLKELANF